MNSSRPEVINKLMRGYSRSLVKLLSARLSPITPFRISVNIFVALTQTTHTASANSTLSSKKMYALGSSTWHGPGACSLFGQQWIQKGFCPPRQKHCSPICKKFQRVANPEINLIRLARQFSGVLHDSPSAVFYLVPPICPPMTAIGSHFGIRSQDLSISGLSSRV